MSCHQKEFKQQFNIISTKIHNIIFINVTWDGGRVSKNFQVLNLERTEEIMNPTRVLDSMEPTGFVPRSAESSGYVLGSCLAV